MEFYQDILMKCLSLHSVYIAQDHRWHWTNLCGKNTRQKSLFLLGPNIIWYPGIKSVITSSSSMHVLKKMLYLICKANSNNYLIIMINIIIFWFFHLFLVTIAILLSGLSYFNLVFPLIFTYTSRGTLMEITTFRSFRLSPSFEIQWYTS